MAAVEPLALPVTPAPKAPIPARADLGPIEALMADQSVSAILVNGPTDVFIERDGSLVRADVQFASDEEILGVILGIAHRTKSALDESTPMLDARLDDGTIVNAIIPPLAVDGPVLSLRRPHAAVSLEQLVATRSLNRVTASFLTACVRAKSTILVSGTAGSGKSTTLQALVGCIPTGERIMTIEDVPEIRRGSRREMVRLEVPPGADAQARGDLVGKAVKMRTDRLVLGDIREGDAAALIDALPAETDGVLASIHAPTPTAALERLEELMTGPRANRSIATVRRKISQSIHLIVQVAQLVDRTRRVISISEPSLTADGQLAVVELFTFEQSENGAGRWVATGVKPRILERVARAGIQVPDRVFDRAPREEEPATAELQAIITRQAGEIEALRAEVAALRTPREAKLGALLSVVDVVDAISRHSIADESLQSAVTVLKKRLDEMLEGIGFQPVAERGMAFDESAHEIVGEVDQGDVAPRTVAAVRRRGFSANGEIIRRAKVVVAR